MKHLIATATLILASGASLAGTDLYSEGNFSFQNERESVTRSIAHIDPTGTETLYQEASFPVTEENPAEHHGVAHQELPSNLYQEGNFPV